MVNPTHLHMTQVPTPTPSTDWPGNLRDVIDTQQQTIKFLLSQWDQLLTQVGVGGGEFGDPVVLAVDALVPFGYWQVVVPNTPGTVVATVMVNSNMVSIFTGLFWSDGNVRITNAGGVTLARVAVMNPPPDEPETP